VREAARAVFAQLCRPGGIARRCYYETAGKLALRGCLDALRTQTSYSRNAA
jgi:hypothetical protein